MIGLLFFVSLMMKRLSDPQTIRNAFRNLGAPFDEASPTFDATGIDSRPSGEEPRESAVESSPIELQSARIWHYLLERASADILADLASHFETDPSERPRSRLLELTRLWVTTTDKETREWFRADEGFAPSELADLEQWQREWEMFTRYVSNPTDEPNGLESLIGFGIALDRTLLDRVRDASPWNSLEQVALHRVYDWVRKESRFDSKNLVPLLDANVLGTGSSHYRGRWIRLRGTIAKGPKPKTLTSPKGTTYPIFEVWLRTSIESTQPICLYLTSLPVGLSIQEGNTVSPSASGEIPIELEGIHFKRIVYPSQRGVEVAPLILVGPVRLADQPSMEEVSQAAQRARRSLPTLKSWDPPHLDHQLIQSVGSIIRPFLSAMQGDGEVIQELVRDQAPSGKETPNSDLLRILFQLQRWPEILKTAIRRERPIGGTSGLHIEGVATRVDMLTVDRETEDWFGQKAIYRVIIETHSSVKPKQKYVAWVGSVPSEWTRGKALYQPCWVDGLLMEGTHADEPMEDRPSILLSDRIQWRMFQELPADLLRPEIPKLWYHLGLRGVDLQSIDLVRKFQKQSLQGSEGETFYRLLKSCSRLEGMETLLASIREDRRELALLLKDPSRQTYRGTQLSMRVLRVSRVRIDGERDRELFEGDTYYELDGFAELGRAGPVRFQSNPNDANPIVFEKDFPVVVVTKDLPACLIDPSSLTQNDGQRFASISSDVWYPQKSVTVDGVFYRLWQYSSGRSGAEDQQRPQIAPLVVSSLMREIEPRSEKTVRRQLDLFGISIGVVFLGILILVWRLTSAHR